MAEDSTAQGYWDSYNNLQRTKHALIQEYLSGWFPILTSWAGQVLYIDTHAGRGRHASGSLGSPLVALNALLAHKSRDRVLAKSEVRFLFIERDEQCYEALTAELRVLGQLPRGISVATHFGDCEDIIGRELARLRASGRRLAPSFVFVDPHGFRISYPLLAEFMAYSAVEMFINVMWRYLDMAKAQASNVGGKARLLDHIFGGPEWRDAIVSSDSEERARQTLSLIKRIMGARWATPVWMLGSNRCTEYVLLHLTNHPRGRDLMKQVMWKVCPSSDGVFIARKSDDLSQGTLLELEPDLRPLEDWVTRTLRVRPHRWKELTELVRDQNWLEKHLNTVIRRLLKEQVIWAAGTGAATASANPLLSLRVS